MKQEKLKVSMKKNILWKNKQDEKEKWPKLRTLWVKTHEIKTRENMKNSFMEIFWC